MSDGAGPERTLVVGGGRGLGFAVPFEDVRRLVAAADLPPRHRCVTLGRLFDGPPEAADTRYAEVGESGAGTFLDLGGDVRVRPFPADAFEPVPAALATTARRWGWAGLLHDGAALRIVMDVRALAALAAPRAVPSAPLAVPREIPSAPLAVPHETSPAPLAVPHETSPTERS